MTIPPSKWRPFPRGAAFLAVRCCLGLLIIALAAASARADAPAPAGTTMSRDQIIAAAEKMADAQLARISGRKNVGWVAAVMWAGYADLSHASSLGTYADAIDQLGASVHWTPRFSAKTPNSADNLCIAQTFLDAWVRRNDPARITPVQRRIDAVADYIVKKEPPNSPKSKENQLTWWWCDALFMAPPGQARLSAITKDPKYLNAMDTEWWRTAALLYDKEEHLFFRDKSFLNKKTKNGKKVFWSRGNGWVFAGLARTLPYIPKDYPSRPRYIAIFKEMAAKLASLQQPDGTWPPSLLDPAEYPDSEFSGTALDCFAFAWGIDSGILDRATYLPVAEKAWAALLAARLPSGLPGYVQSTGAAPEGVSATGTQLYGTGAFLMAACELAHLAPITLPSPPQLAAPVPTAPYHIKKIADSVIDSSALTLPPGAEYGSSINGQAFQQDAIRTSGSTQYAAYYDGARNICVARRRLPDGKWEVLRFVAPKFSSNDAHNTISLGICDKDGTIHLSFDQHDSVLHYTVSKPGLATHPDKFQWTPALFGVVHSDLQPNIPLSITYPRFWDSPDGGLQFQYRVGSSGNGDNMLVDYDPKTGTWSGATQIDSSDGDFQDDLGSSAHRNGYPNGFDYDTAGRLHTTWVWREDSKGSNHDLLYAYSDDMGKTWSSDSGQPIAGPATINTPGLAVVKISRRQGLMNNQAQALDSKDDLHVVMWSSDSETPPVATGTAVWGNPADRRYHHYWREGPGLWHDDVIPLHAGSRPRLFIDSHDNLILIYNRPLPDEPMESGIYFTRGDLVIASASAAADWHDWHIVTEEKGPFINEMLADTTRWRSQKILSIIVQNTPKVIGNPSPLRVIDYQWKQTP